ncbi:MAG: hypothetical protein HY809_09435 [Nitrospirae bacterium]|nr:hypothetical protein [Nitrospirota bacterium]
MNGEIIIARAYRDKPLIRRIWSSNEKVVFITNNEQFQLLTEGLDAIEPIGFPKEDIFQYDESMADLINKGMDNIDWNILRKWSN